MLKKHNCLNSLHDHCKFEVELINPAGTYWGNIFIFQEFTGTYLYFKSNSQKLDDLPNLDEIKYNLRSMSDSQKDRPCELLICIEDIDEIITKNYLCNPIAAEIFDFRNNRMYLFSFLQANKRKEFFNKMKSYISESKLIEDCKQEFENRRYQFNWKSWSKPKIILIFSRNKHIWLFNDCE